MWKRKEEVSTIPDPQSGQSSSAASGVEPDNNPTELVNRSMPIAVMRINSTLYKLVDFKKGKRTTHHDPSNPDLNSSITLNMSSKKELINSNDSINLCFIKPEINIELPPLFPVSATEAIKVSEKDEGNAHSARDQGRNYISNKTIMKNEDNQRCVCCDKEADAVLLPCCHGGICFECGNNLAKRNAICHFCRHVFALTTLFVLEFLASAQDRAARKHERFS